MEAEATNKDYADYSIQWENDGYKVLNHPLSHLVQVFALKFWVECRECDVQSLKCGLAKDREIITRYQSQSFLLDPPKGVS